MMIEKTKGEFNKYIDSISPDTICKYAEKFAGITFFCNSHFPCRFRNRETLKHRGVERNECNRPRLMKLKKIL